MSRGTVADDAATKTADASLEGEEVVATRTAQESKFMIELIQIMKIKLLFMF